MQTRTIQKIKPVIENHFEYGWRRCDYLNQKKLEKQVEKHDIILRKHYANIKPDKRPPKNLCQNTRKGMSKKSSDTKRH